MPNRAYPLDDVQQMVQDFNGICTWDFSQGIPLNFVAGPTGTGICLALSCHWIKYHGTDDSLVNHLGAVWNPVTRTYIPFNQQQYQRIAAWQRNIATLPNWVIGYQNWFRNQRFNILSTSRVAMNLTAFRPELERVNEGYALIILDSANAAESHAVAAFIGGPNEDSCFFDPNYGEFWFSDREDFFFFLHLFFNFCYRQSHQHNTGFNRCQVVRMRGPA